MWPRIIEVMLGCWLVISPFVFRHAADDRFLRLHDVGVGAAVVTLALLCFWRPLRHARFGVLAIAGWLIFFARSMGSADLPPAHQNHIVIGLLLVLFGILPNEVNSPPEEWREITK